MKKTSYTLILIFLLGFIYSCRPSYMRCPKNRRCVDINKTSKKDFLDTKKGLYFSMCVNSKS
ncbi:hypothetical protein [Pseudofulvibacter geojedonensis]|uniref:Lipoprotein n=1 Tax=Pseudofulvibacter geojedonensis TaxID=1123758 RepID=A0ABW3I1Y4_9FLAO